MFMTRLLLNEAEKKPLQYAFLTPQNTSQIHQTKDLSILKFVYFCLYFHHLSYICILNRARNLVLFSKNSISGYRIQIAKSNAASATRVYANHFIF